jgi:hypothetical protein
MPRQLELFSKPCKRSSALSIDVVSTRAFINALCFTDYNDGGY